MIPAGESAEANIDLVLGAMTNFIAFVTSTEVKTAEVSGDDAQRFLYFHTEAFPELAEPGSHAPFRDFERECDHEPGGRSRKQ